MPERQANQALRMRGWADWLPGVTSEPGQPRAGRDFFFLRPCRDRLRAWLEIRHLSIRSATTSLVGGSRGDPDGGAAVCSGCTTPRRLPPSLRRSPWCGASPGQCQFVVQLKWWFPASSRPPLHLQLPRRGPHRGCRLSRHGKPLAALCVARPWMACNLTVLSCSSVQG